MPKPVAVDGDTQVETSTAKFQADSNQTGSWQLVTSNVVFQRLELRLINPGYPCGFGC